jgi:hypothetical protein
MTQQVFSAEKPSGEMMDRVVDEVETFFVMSWRGKRSFALVPVLLNRILMRKSCAIRRCDSR